MLSEAIQKHRAWRGKIEMVTRADVSTKEALADAYTPGVADACLAIQADVGQSYELTRRWNTVAIVSDGTAVLGLGDIGPEASMPVMEGKAALFKEYGGVDAIPLCVRTTDVDEIVQAISLFAGSFGGINLEDIAAPRCFEIESRLKELCDIPVFHDDQHGTAIVALAGLVNALKVVGKDLAEVRIVFFGAGAAACATAQLFFTAGARDITMVNREAIIDPAGSYPGLLGEIAPLTNPEGRTGAHREAIVGADVFIGLSGPGALTQDMVRAMADDPIIFAMANPTPEIMPDEAMAAGAAVVATGRSDFPNQINNLLAFPGMFRGLFDVGARTITADMYIAAARTIAAVVLEPTAGFVIPDGTDHSVGLLVAKAVADVYRANESTLTSEPALPVARNQESRAVDSTPLVASVAAY